MSFFNKEKIHYNRSSLVRTEIQELLKESPTVEEVDDKLTIAELEEELEATSKKIK
jgi:hypothetical protein